MLWFFKLVPNVTTLWFIFKANIRTIGEALLGYILSLPNSKCAEANGTSSCSLLKDNAVEIERISYWMHRYGSRPRPLAGENMWFTTELRDLITR